MQSRGPLFELARSDSLVVTCRGAAEFIMTLRSRSGDSRRRNIYQARRRADFRPLFWTASTNWVARTRDGSNRESRLYLAILPAVYRPVVIVRPRIERIRARLFFGRRLCYFVRVISTENFANSDILPVTNFDEIGIARSADFQATVRTREGSYVTRKKKRNAMKFRIAPASEI